MDSILTSIKKLLGMTEDYTHFDADLIMHINSAFMILHQLGVGPSKRFAITGAYETWNEFMEEEESLDAVKTYIYQKVKLVFDPPTSSSVLASNERITSELEWRLNVAAESSVDE